MNEWMIRRRENFFLDNFNQPRSIDDEFQRSKITNYLPVEIGNPLLINGALVDSIGADPEVSKGEGVSTVVASDRVDCSNDAG